MGFSKQPVVGVFGFSHESFAPSQPSVQLAPGVIEKKLADRKSVEQQKLARENIVREKMGITV